MAFCNCFLWHVEIRKSFCLAFRMQIVLFCECTTFVAELSINSCKIITHTHTQAAAPSPHPHTDVKINFLTVCPFVQLAKWKSLHKCVHNSHLFYCINLSLTAFTRPQKSPTPVHAPPLNHKQIFCYALLVQVNVVQIDF